MRACLAIPPIDGDYPYSTVAMGLRAAGFELPHPRETDLADILVVWSPWKGSHRAGLQHIYAAAGKPVVVMENGWLSPIRTVKFYQIAFDGWNGTGRFVTGDNMRWRSWKLPEMPWGDREGYALVCGQRGHPNDARTAVPNWHQSLIVPNFSPQRVVRRARESGRDLFADLRGAAECHVWTSNAASWAVMEGVPVVQHGPNLMVSALASRPGEPLYRGDRGAELERLAWAQWSADEIATGAPFRRLLEAA